VTHPLIHRNFRLERIYPVPPARVFAAWADPEIKIRWFGGPSGWKEEVRTHDFRVGSGEEVTGVHASGVRSKFVCRYHSIATDAHIVYVYDMEVGDQPMSTSLATVEFVAVEGGTRMTYSEQIAFVDGKDGGDSREQGTNWLLDKIGETLGS
jgi:uncharacterized protein YndB with AHSA1/START domain